MFLKRILFISTILASFFIASSAFAISLQDAKQQGLVGEQPNGYLAAVSSATAEVNQLIAKINSERKKAYQAIAAKNGTPLSSVEKVAGKTAIEKTQPGHYFRDTAQVWHKK